MAGTISQFPESDWMSNQPKRRALSCGYGFVLLIAALNSRASASIVLEFRPASQTALVGSTVYLGLYAVWDGQPHDTLAAVEAIVDWAPMHLKMLTVSNAGAVPLLSSGFPANDPYHLNEVVPPQDGDALYQALANFGSPVRATSAGVLLTTLRFTALTQTPQTPVDFLVSGGWPLGYTRVFDGSMPNLDITGGLHGATVTIVPEPGSGLLILAGLAMLGRRARNRKLVVPKWAPI
jgi:PEP-CTERM motif-containing protein